MTIDRCARLQAALRANGVDAVALVPGPNLFYLLGMTMHASERLALAILRADGRHAMVLPALEQPRAASEARIGLAFYPWRDEEGFEAALSKCCDELGLAGTQLAVEYTAMRVLELRALEAAAQLQISDATPIIAGLRMVKDDQELGAMQEAARIVEVALHKAIHAIRPGMTELEVADIWEDAMVEAGASGPSFTTIVASGPNSANPHHTTGTRQLQVGDLIIFDGGAIYNGYCSDITRTVMLGQPSEEQLAIYRAVQAANEEGRAACRPGATGAQIDAAARAVIEEAGFGPAFVHRTGHGLGIEIHEPPYLHAKSTTPLDPGTTFTVEPGVYIDSIGGVRIEDDMVLTADGAQSLTNYQRELLIIEAAR